MPGTDPSHWLHRLDAGEWLAAAETELRHGHEALARRAIRPAVTHARRAAGMAMNGILVAAPHERWGRSYMEHVNALAAEPAAPDEVRAAAAVLRDTPPLAPELVKLGKPDTRALDGARRIITWARAIIATPPA
jgi:HEPN domain-containing protein